MNEEHSCTSMAVKAVVSEIKRRLSLRFSELEGFPDFYYDFDKGLSEQFKQYYAKIPERDRQNDWYILAYSYDSSEASDVQPRRGFTHKRQIRDGLYRILNVRFTNLSIVFSILTNNSKMLNSISNCMLNNLDWSFTIEFQDLLWPTWIANKAYPLGWYIRPTIPNGCIYMCNKAGTTSETEPEWQNIVGQAQKDGETEWLCLEPDSLAVLARDFVKNDTVIQNPIDQGIMYQYDFGYVLHYIDLSDTNDFVGIVENAEVALMNWPGSPYFKEIVRVPD